MNDTQKISDLESQKAQATIFGQTINKQERYVETLESENERLREALGWLNINLGIPLSEKERPSLKHTSALKPPWTGGKLTVQTVATILNIRQTPGKRGGRDRIILRCKTNP
jgi:hypothetical protein